MSRGEIFRIDKRIGEVSFLQVSRLPSSSGDHHAARGLVRLLLLLLNELHHVGGDGAAHATGRRRSQVDAQALLSEFNSHPRVSVMA